MVHIYRAMIKIEEERSLLGATLFNVDVSKPRVVQPQRHLACFSHICVFNFGTVSRENQIFMVFHRRQLLSLTRVK